MNRLANLPPGTWSISRQEPNTGTVQPRIAGLRILPWRSRPRAPPMSGWNRYPTRITVNCHDKKATCQNGWLEINNLRRSLQRLYVLNRLQLTTSGRNSSLHKKPISPLHNSTREKPVSEKYWLVQHTNPTTTRRPLLIKLQPDKS